MNSKLLFYTVVVVMCIATAGVSHAAEISNSQGEVSVHHPNRTVGDTIPQGTTVKANGSDTTFVDIALSDTQQVRIQGGEVELRKLGDKTRLNLNSGKLFYADDKSTLRDVTVKTPNAIAGVRGTKFFVKASPDKTYYCICEGEVVARKRGLWYWMFGKEVTIQPGEDAYVHSDRPVEAPEKNPQMFEQTWEVFQDMGIERR